MLVFSRKLGEKIVIGDNIVITVVKIDRNQIRIGIEAPSDISVYREEIAPQRVMQGRAVRGRRSQLIDVSPIRSRASATTHGVRLGVAGCRDGG